MKICFLLLISSVLVITGLQAQTNDAPGFKRFGFRAGVNFSHINFSKGSPPPAVPIETNWSPGINMGFLMLVPVTDQLFFQPEYAYSQMNSKITSTNTTYKLSYFSLPLFLKYRLHEKFGVMAGPQFDLLLGAKKDINGSSTDITHDTEERSIGVTAGIEFQIIKSLFLCARYMQGLNHIGLGQRTNVQEFKFEMFQFTAGINF